MHGEIQDVDWPSYIAETDAPVGIVLHDVAARNFSALRFRLLRLASPRNGVATGNAAPANATSISERVGLLPESNADKKKAAPRR